LEQEPNKNQKDVKVKRLFGFTVWMFTYGQARKKNIVGVVLMILKILMK
jgi:hypothetical protein